MPPQYPIDAVIVSKDSLASNDPADVIYSNIDVVNEMFEQLFKRDEIARDALLSYYVDYFLAERNNGGFSQFVYNSRWGDCIEYITDGFAAIGATKHLEQFEEAAGKMQDRPGIEGLKKFFASDYFDDNPERDILNEYDEGFDALQESEDLTELNAAWLRGLPNLVALSPAEIEAEISQRIAAQPDRAVREAEARAAEPRLKKLIRALCVAAGQQFDRMTAGDPANKYQGEQIIAWSFLTNQGHHRMIDRNGRALMFKGHTEEIVCEIEAGPEFD